MLKKSVALVIILAVLAGAAVPAQAAGRDPLDDLAESYLAAVQSGQPSYLYYTTDYDDLQLLIAELFSKYPMLMHYFQSGESTTYQDHMEVTFYLYNTEDHLDDIWVVDSDEALDVIANVYAGDSISGDGFTKNTA